MTNDQTLLEKVARAMCAPFDPDENVLLGTYKKRWETHVDQAQAAIDTICAEIAEPNEAMIYASSKKALLGRFSSLECWRAMLNASPLGGQKDG